MADQDEDEWNPHVCREACSLLGIELPRTPVTATHLEREQALQAWKDGPLKDALKNALKKYHPDNKETGSADTFKAAKKAHGKLLNNLQVRPPAPPPESRWNSEPDPSPWGPDPTPRVYPPPGPTGPSGPGFTYAHQHQPKPEQARRVQHGADGSITLDLGPFAFRLNPDDVAMFAGLAAAAENQLRHQFTRQVTRKKEQLRERVAAKAADTLLDLDPDSFVDGIFDEILPIKAKVRQKKPSSRRTVRVGRG